MLIFMEPTRDSPSMEVVEPSNKCQLLQQIVHIIFDPKDMIASESNKNSPIKLDDKFVYALLKVLRCYAYLYGKYTGLAYYGTGGSVENLSILGITLDDGRTSSPGGSGSSRVRVVGTGSGK